MGVPAQEAGRETAEALGREARLTAPLIRAATVQDADTIAQIHVAAWRECYAELFPAEALASLDIAERARLWREIILAGPASGATLLLEFAGEGAVGFSSCGAQRSDRLREQGFLGEFEAVYIVKRGQQRGGGRALMRAMARHLLGQGCEAASVWVFRDNPPARRFYEALGAVATGIDGTWTTLGQTLPDLSYGWRDLRGLARE
ncbi:MAG: GNAT family N-acetyltransferase [Methylocystis sp.]